MKKTSIYLDTSVISYLDVKDTPEKMKQTLELWDYILENKYKVYISTITLAEINKCPEPKRSFMLSKLREVSYIELKPRKGVTNLTLEYLSNQVLSKKSEIDLRHIAFAVVNKIDCIVSWNFKHFVNKKTTKKVNSINVLLGYKYVEIVSPAMIIGGDKNEK